MVVVLDHDTACAMLREAGREPPEIPPGCNTVTRLVEMQAGALLERVCDKLLEDD